MKTLKLINPIWFYKTSMSFMQGYSKLHIWSRMPKAYIKYCYYMLTGK